MNKLVSLLIFVPFCVSNSQISFNSLPTEKQLVARDIQTNIGTVSINGEVNLGDNYNLEYSSWANGEHNNSPSPEDAAEIINYLGNWNDANASDAKPSYVEYC